VRRLLDLFLLIVVIPPRAYSQYWQQQVNYTIDVSLNDKEHALDGFETIEYFNNSPDTLRFIWFHIWPNAYKNDRTAFTDQSLENGNTKFYFSGKEQKGYINRLDFKIDEVTAQMEDHPNHIDIVKVILPVPLPPGQKTTITTPFHVKLPYNFSRGGHDGQSYQVTQWFPKPAVYDKKGWHPMPYVDQGEFYSEFGTFKVRITLPKNYVVAATGELQDPVEKEWLKSRASFDWQPIAQKEKTVGGGVKTTLQKFPESSSETKTLYYSQDNIHDFAWFADKRFIVNHDTTRLASGRVIDVYTYYTASHKEVWKDNLQNAKDAIHHYSRLVGEYPYNVVSVVQGPQGYGAGMEYPTITIIAPGMNKKSVDITIAHEIGHNWFYGILGSNERDHPWLDEGINSYYDNKYEAAKYGKKNQLERILFETKAVTKTDQPIELPSEEYSATNYGLSVYYKTAEWLRYLENLLGTEVFNAAMQNYYQQWKYRHPQPEDFKKVMEESSGRNLDSAFSLLTAKGTLPNQHRTGTKPIFIFDIKSLDAYLKAPSKDVILFGPAIGFNSYDKLMAGAFVTNLKWPPSNFQFFLAPMYSTGAKRINGIGFLSHSIYSYGFLRKLELRINGSRFTMGEFKGFDEAKASLSFLKIVPGIKLSFRNKNARSSLNRFISFKTFLLQEDALQFYQDSVFNPPDTTVFNRFRTISESSTLNQLQFVIENNRALYPYRGELKIEQGKDFVRAGFTGNYFFNYSKEGGLNVRLFAGKFFYPGSKTISKQFSTGRYHLNMTGPNGFEDYTYSDYFIGRNRFEGALSQQIMVRDGAFKVRTDLLANEVGRTDDWLMAVNFSTNVPSAINPLTALPVKIPLKLFFDIGTQAGAWKQETEDDRFLYDAGIQLSLFGETINIYLPILYSSVFKDYIQSTLPKKGRIWKTISFSIDISNFSLRRMGRNIDL
jgi:hypothetical protein